MYKPSTTLLLSVVRLSARLSRLLLIFTRDSSLIGIGSFQRHNDESDTTISVG